jgi:hypothetical protein
MQLDFHYYCIGVLARAAGFEPADALVLAYASQYVDDATETGVLKLSDDVPGPHFDPVRSSYFGLETVHSLTWDAQKRVWIPFHFLPQSPFDPEDGDGFTFVTGANSSFARLVLEEAVTEPLERRKRRLCRIGVALHTYADSWSHQDFSGRESAEENNVEAIHIYDREAGAWEHLEIENILFDLLPFIGHGEAGYFPDLAFQRWKCDVGQPARPIERDNPAFFLEAAEAIYNWLLVVDKAGSEEPVPWAEIAPGIATLLAEEGEEPRWVDQITLPAYRAFLAADVEDRCENWKQDFGHLFQPNPGAFAYDKLAWRQAAVEGPVAWDDYSQQDWSQMPARETKPGFWDSLWVHFHRAALRQRHFVLERLP